MKKCSRSKLKSPRLRVLLALGATFLIPTSDSIGAHSLDLSNANSGSMKIGNDTNSCDSSLQGALRYNSTSKIIQVCTDKLGSYQWTDWGA